MSWLYYALKEYLVEKPRHINTRFYNDKIGLYPFIPCRLFPHPIQQMVVSKMLPIPKVKWSKTLITFQDGTTCRLDIEHALASANANSLKGIILFCHGFGGSVDSTYCAHFAHHAKKQGYTTVIYNRRAHVPESISPTYPIHYDQDDLETVIDWIKTQYPGNNLYGVGMSMGGNIIAKYAGIKGDTCPFTRVVSVCNGFDIRAGVYRFEKNPMINNVMMEYSRDLIKNIKNIKGSIFGKNPTFGFSPQTTFSQLEHDALYTFNGKDHHMPHFYNEQSSLVELKKITVPALCIFSDDDIFLHHSSEFYQDIVNSNPQITVIVPSHGSHMGFVSSGFEVDWWIKNTLAFLA